MQLAAHLDTLSSYVPALVLRHLSTQAGPLDAPLSERFPAAVLLADISGFTPLAERLAQRGPAGVEALSQLLNAYFEQLVGLVAALGGDVVKFAGDSLLAIWPVQSVQVASEIQSLAEATLRAAQCGLAVQMMLHEYQAAQGVQLSLRVGIGAGEVFGVYLGGVQARWELLISGDPLAQTGAALRLARPGEVVVSPAVWRLIGGQSVGAVIENETGLAGARLENLHHPLPLLLSPPVRLLPEMEAGLRAFIPHAVLSRLEAGQLNWLAELRQVTVVLIGLPDMDHTIPLEQAQAGMRLLQTALLRYEGIINKLSVDDKGVTVVAAFGLPPLAHEDDALRAVLAAQACQSGLSQMGWSSAVGLASGWAFCGSVGGRQRREYTMIGDVVNLAARLMQAAPDYACEQAGQTLRILCDAATCQAARARVEFDALPAISVKGKAGTIPIYRPRGPKRKAARSQTDIVGRERERDAIWQALQALARGERGGVIVIEGEPGIGKSRLVEHARQQARRLGVRTLSGAGDAMEKDAAFRAWRSIFSAWLGLDALTDPAARRAQALRRLEAKQQARAPLLNAALPLDFEDNELTRQMSGRVRADNTRELLLELLQQAARQAPLVVFLEDAHWLDSASWALALEVSQRAPALLLVLDTRPPGEDVPEYSRLLELPATLFLRLQPLPPADALTLVCLRLGVTSLPAPAAQIIQDKAEGNPFFSEELGYALRDAGILRIHNGECRLADGVDLQAVALPETVQGVIASRIDRLTPPQQLALKVASVIGRVFTLRLLRDLYPIESDKPRLSEYLEILERLDLTPLETPEPEPSYFFKHIITQQVAYNLMLFSQRRELHRSVAEWHERHYTGNLAPLYALLAFHWSRAIDPASADRTAVDKAVEYLAKAGEHALSASAFREARTFLEQALAILPPSAPPHERVRLLVQLGETLWQLSDYAAARQRLDDGLALARASNDLLGIADALTNLGRVSWQRGEFDRARTWLNEGLEVATALGDARRLFNVFNNLGVVAFYQGDYVEAGEHFQKSLFLARQVGDRSSEAQFLNNLGNVARKLQAYEQARAHYQAGLAICQDLGIRWVMAVTLANLALVAHKTRAYDEARQYQQESLALHRQNGNQWGVSIVLREMGMLACDLGEYDQASRHLLESLEVAAAIQAAPKALGALAGWARLWARTGQVERAAETVGLVMAHPSTDSEAQEIVELARAELENRMPPAELQAAIERGKASSFEDLVYSILANASSNVAGALRRKME